tara:strand:+ start:388 stop:552 length:165 start_codon:yes stop_codon:yes gene_type:complete
LERLQDRWRVDLLDTALMLTVGAQDLTVSKHSDASYLHLHLCSHITGRETLAED